MADSPSSAESVLARLVSQAKAAPSDSGPLGLRGAEATDASARRADEKLQNLVRRIQGINPATARPAKIESPAEAAAPAISAGATANDEALSAVAALVKSAAAKASAAPDDFLPKDPASLVEAQLTESEVEALILKLLLAKSESTGRSAAEHIRLPFRLLDQLLLQMKQDYLVVHKGAAPMNDYVYQLTDLGRERARRLWAHCTYFGAVPVSLKDYIEGVKAQSLTKQHPTLKDLQRAFSDLVISPHTLERLGPAINSGRGLFLYGAAGNGKTSIAERVTRVFGEFVWMPRALGIDGEIIRLFDPCNHEEAPPENGAGLLDQSFYDKRWVRIRRPTIIVGGELTMDNLEVTLNTSTGISEAPMQLKSNCGTLVIDDFGRQRMSIDELLNRWIVPLEKRYDYLNLPNGKKIQAPFDQLIIFSTNLEPKALVDEAFLRRIPYKIEVLDPTEDEFRELFRIMAPKHGFEHDEKAINYLIEQHYRAARRPLRSCHPRDLLMQIRNRCLYQTLPLELTADNLDFAVENCFVVMRLAGD